MIWTETHDDHRYYHDLSENRWVETPALTSGSPATRRAPGSWRALSRSRARARRARPFARPTNHRRASPQRTGPPAGRRARPGGGTRTPTGPCRGSPYVGTEEEEKEKEVEEAAVQLLFLPGPPSPRTRGSTARPDTDTLSADDLPSGAHQRRSTPRPAERWRWGPDAPVGRVPARAECGECEADARLLLLTATVSNATMKHCEHQLLPLCASLCHSCTRGRPDRQSVVTSLRVAHTCMSSLNMPQF